MKEKKLLGTINLVLRVIIILFSAYMASVATSVFVALLTERNAIAEWLAAHPLEIVVFFIFFSSFLFVGKDINLDD